MLYYCSYNYAHVQRQRQVKVSIWSHLVFSRNHSSTVMVRDIAFQLQYGSFPSHSLVVSPYYAIAVCISSHPAHVRIGRASLLYNHVRCIWMTPNLSTLEYLSAFEFLFGSQVCMRPSISNIVWVMSFSPSLRALLTGCSSATITVSRCPNYTVQQDWYLIGNLLLKRWP